MFAIALPNTRAALIAEYGIVFLGFITLAAVLFQLSLAIR
jgi:hypothetical protein